jgi:hypothetical protein
MEVDSEEFQNDNINKKESNLFGNEKNLLEKKKNFFFFLNPFECLSRWNYSFAFLSLI